MPTWTVSGKQKINFYKQAQNLRQKYAALGGSVGLTGSGVAQGNKKIRTSTHKKSRNHMLSRKPVPEKRLKRQDFSIKKSKPSVRSQRTNRFLGV